MSDANRSYPTALGTSDADSIRLLGHDLAGDLMGQVGFGELAYWLVARRRPTPGQVRVLEAVLVALADHGFTPTAIAARMTYLSAPDSLQGALAAGLLGGGSRFLGVTEDAGRFLADALAAHDGPLPDDDAGWDALALAVVQRGAGGQAVRARPRPPGAQGARPADTGAAAASARRRGCAVVTCACTRRSAGSIPRCSAARSRSTAPACAERHSPTSTCRSRCCAASPCSPAPPVCWASWPRNANAR